LDFIPLTKICAKYLFPFANKATACLGPNLNAWLRLIIKNSSKDSVSAKGLLESILSKLTSPLFYTIKNLASKTNIY